MFPWLWHQLCAVLIGTCEQINATAIAQLSFTVPILPTVIILSRTRKLYCALIGLIDFVPENNEREVIIVGHVRLDQEFVPPVF
jgi:hypothetical protein